MTSILLCILQILEIAVIIDIDGLVREHVIVELCAIVIGHRCHVVDNYLVRLCLKIWESGMIVVAINKVDMMLEYRR